MYRPFNPKKKPRYLNQNGPIYPEDINRYNEDLYLGGKAGGGSFSPASLAGLQLWLKADALVLNNNDPVSSFTDSSAQGHTVTQAVALRQPIFKTNIQNGKPIVRFDGVDDYFDVPFGLGAGDYALFVVLSETKPDLNVECILNGNAPSIFFNIQSGNNQISPAWFDNAWHEFGTSVVGFQLIEFILPTGGTGEIFRNGVSLGTAAYTATQLNAVGNALFQATSGGAANVAGDLAELILCNVAPNAATRQQVESYLNGRWAIF